MSEHDEQAALIQWAALYEARCPALKRLFAIPNGGKRDVVTAARLKAEGVKPGVPDLCLPVARGGYHGLYIEMKIPGGRVRPEQRAWLAEAEADGYMTAICYTWPEAARVLITYLGADIPLPG